MRIVRLESNVKAATPRGWAVDLGLHSLIVGDPGSGKTAIVTAVELALTGQPSDVLFKDPKAAARIARLAPEGAKELFATAYFDTGEVARWSLPLGKGKPAPDLPSSLRGWGSSLLPMRSVRDLFEADATKARATLLKAFGDREGYDQERALAGLDRRTRPLADALLDEASPPPATAEQLWSWLARRASAKKLECDAQARGFEARGAEPVHQGERVSEQDVQEAERAVAYAVASRVVACYVQALVRLDAAQAVLDECVFEDVDLDVLGVLEAAEEAARCPCCSRPWHAMAAVKADMQEKAQRTRAYWKAQREVDGAQRGVEIMEGGLQETADLQALVDAHVARYGLAGDGSDGERLPDVDALRREEDALRARHAAQQGAARSYAADAKDAREEAARWKELADAAEAQLQVELKRALKDIDGKASSYLPAGWEIKLDTETDFVPSLVRGDLPGRTGRGLAFSGGEGQTILMALARLTLPRGQPYACLIPDDRDRGNLLVTWLRTWKDWPHQILLTSTHGCAGVDEFGWTLVDAAHATRPAPKRVW